MGDGFSTLRQGVFDSIGAIHMHVDGVWGLWVWVLCWMLKLFGYTELNKVVAFVDGPQRKALPETYQAHTPAQDGAERLEMFTTTLVRNRKNAIRLLNFVGRVLRWVSGAIVELEQTVGWVDNGGWKWIESFNEVVPLRQSEVRVKLQASEKYEVHHGFDYPKSNATPQQLADLIQTYCDQYEMSYGGWFVFERPDYWSCWSNGFFPAEWLPERVESQRILLKEFLKREGLNGDLATLVERVLAISHSGV